ncbi:MAG: hypothetical protein KGL35_13815, partial [Bradyrhizobium sp.]|nr:hypothetical protein [Bradyrhizobium sp.]
MGGLTSQQLITIALQTARVPGWTAQAGQLLNSILSDLCQTYDLDVAKGTFSFNFNVGLISSAEFPNMQAGSGPYTLPATYLRAVRDEVMWFNQGVPYPLIPIDLSEFDWQVQQAGNQAYPYLWATDMSQTPPVGIVWPGASGAFPCMVRYYQQMPDIGSGGTSANGWSAGTAAPEVSSVVPWFPNQRYLLKQLSGMLMELADDTRAQTFLGDGDPNNPGAQAILRHYLMLRDDNSNRAKR